MYSIPNYKPDSLLVFALANTCPATNGRVVYAARNLYNRLTGSINNYSNNCNSNTYSRKNIVPVAANKGLLIYPNPARSNVYIKYKAIRQVVIYDYTGRKLLSNSFNNVDNAQLNVSKLNKGCYIIKLTATNKGIISAKLIIE